jgi:orotate phosphoribosyltransferase
MTLERRLLSLLALFGYQYKEEGFTLASGGTSKEYLDCRAALSNPTVLWNVGRFVRAQLHGNVIAIGGLTLGADPIAISVSIASEVSETGNSYDWFTVRKEPKDHGTKKLIEGSVKPGDHVCIVDDVCTTGNSTIKAINAAVEFGLRINQVIILVDRSESSGLDKIRAILKEEKQWGYHHTRALFTLDQIRDEWTLLGTRDGVRTFAKDAGEV